MKTVGQLLHAQRNQSNFSIEQLSVATKIDPKYISALESDHYDLLPSETFAKGFIRNLCLALGADPDEFIAVFRRDFRHPEEKNKTTFTHHSSVLNIPHLSSQAVPIILGVAVFVIYLGFQFRAILTLPPLEISKPLENAVLASPIDIEGTTSTDSLVTINDDNVVKPDQNGAFQISLNLPIGETTINVKATNRFSRTSTVVVPITIISK
jgi:cytoskeletal protein RodZ